MLLRLAFGGCLFLAATWDSPCQAQAKGEKVHLAATYGQVPYFENEAGYTAYLAVVKAATPQSANAIKRMYLKSQHLLPEGAKVEIVEVAEGPKLAGITSPTLVPPLIVKRVGTEGAVFVPSFYLRPAGGKPFPIESKFPVLASKIAYGIARNSGSEVIL
jgi:hypothetical protein